VPISTYTQGVGDAFRNIGDFASDLVAPTVRLGVTGLARSGKTVFITALVHNLIAGGRLPFFNAAAQGRVLRAYLEPQPDDAVPRFAYEKHLADLTAGPPSWPESTRRISQLRLTLEYASTRFWKRQLGRERLHIDIVDYPGEWLLDLPLLRLDYAAWSRTAINARPNRLRTMRIVAMTARTSARSTMAPAGPRRRRLRGRMGGKEGGPAGEPGDSTMPCSLGVSVMGGGSKTPTDADETG